MSKAGSFSQKDVKALNQVHEDLNCKQQMLQAMSHSQKLQNKNGVMKHENFGQGDVVLRNKKKNR